MAGAKDGDEYVKELCLLDIKKVDQPFQNAVVIKRGAFSDSLKLENFEQAQNFIKTQIKG